MNGEMRAVALVRQKGLTESEADVAIWAAWHREDLLRQMLVARGMKRRDARATSRAIRHRCGQNPYAADRPEN